MLFWSTAGVEVQKQLLVFGLIVNVSRSRFSYLALVDVIHFLEPVEASILSTAQKYLSSKTQADQTVDESVVCAIGMRERGPYMLLLWPLLVGPMAPTAPASPTKPHLCFQKQIDSSFYLTVLYNLRIRFPQCIVL